MVEIGSADGAPDHNGGPASMRPIIFLKAARVAGIPVCVQACGWPSGLTASAGTRAVCYSSAFGGKDGVIGLPVVDS